VLVAPPITEKDLLMSPQAVSAQLVLPHFPNFLFLATAKTRALVPRKEKATKDTTVS